MHSSSYVTIKKQAIFVTFHAEIEVPTVLCEVLYEEVGGETVPVNVITTEYQFDHLLPKEIQPQTPGKMPKYKQCQRQIMYTV